MENLIEGIQREQRRCRELLVGYKEIGPAGAFGAKMIQIDLDRSEEAIACGDTIEMMRAYKALQGVD